MQPSLPDTYVRFTLAITSTIPSAAPQAIAGGLQSPGGSAGPKGLLDFLSLILGNAGQTQAGQAQGTTNSGGQDLQAKIAALLKAHPGLQNNSLVQSVLKLLQPGADGQPATGGLSAQDLLKKIADLLQNPATAAPASTDIKPTLTSDLAPSAAPVLQAAPQDTTALDKLRAKIDALLQTDSSAPADKQVADMLNALEPQGGTAQIQIDPKMLQQLKDKLSALSGGADDQDAFAQFKEDLIRFMKDKGLQAPAIHQYLAALDQSLKSGVGTNAAADDRMSALPQTTAPGAPAAPAAAATPEQAQGMSDAAQKHSTQNIPAQPAPVQTQGAQDAPAPKAADTMPLHASIVNALASGDADLGGSGQSGAQLFGQQQDLTGMIGLVQTPNDINTQGFVNYMAAARGNAAPVTQMVSLQMQANALQGISSMTLQLSPADLGRLDVRMKFDKDGTVKAHLTADKPETLALLQRDSSHLQKALQQAGFDADDTTISFDLRQQQQDLGQARDNGSNGNGYPANADEATDNNTIQANIAVQSAGIISQNRVNIMV